MRDTNIALRKEILETLAVLLLDDKRLWRAIDGGGYDTIVNDRRVCICQTMRTERPHKLTYEGLQWIPSVVDDDEGEKLLEKIYLRAQWSALTTVLNDLTAK